jgi:predicted ATP-dependent serine protease
MLMAYVREQYCRHCEAEKTHTNGKCNTCREREHREAMAAWQAKTTDEKLLDIHKRLLRLEAGPAQY